jgi:hypothetical protein
MNYFRIDGIYDAIVAHRLLHPDMSRARTTPQESSTGIQSGILLHESTKRASFALSGLSIIYRLHQTNVTFEKPDL